jgi:outer membrane protein TolC
VSVTFVIAVALVGGLVDQAASDRGSDPGWSAAGGPRAEQTSQTGTPQSLTAAQPQPANVPPLTLQAALNLARANSQQFRSALTASQLAAEDRTQARAALFPLVTGTNGFIYTEPNGTPSGVFVANNGPHEYILWGQAHGDVFAPAKWADYRRAQAAEAAARAKADVAARGLVAAVVQAYYAVAAAQHKAANAQQSLREAQQFLEISQRLEQGGEVAHSDVVKSQIQLAQRQREAQDADLTFEKSRMGLAVLIFPDYRDNFTVVDDLVDTPPLPALADVKAAATQANPDIRAAQASLTEESFSAAVARRGMLPSVSFDYWYGLDANEFAVNSHDPLGVLRHNIGSSGQAVLTVPLWNWGSLQSKLRQAELRVQQARVDLSLAQRQLLASINLFYREAETAFSQVASLRDSLAMAVESLRLTLLRYQAGEVTVLEVVDAQTTLILARNAYDDGLLRYRVALAALQTLTGIL